jgi:hypothetical protein
MDATRGLRHRSFGGEIDDYTIEVAGTLFGSAQVEIEKGSVDAFFAVNGQEITGYSLHAILQ